MTYVLIYFAIGCINTAGVFWIMRHMKQDKDVAQIIEYMHMSAVLYWAFTLVFILTWPVFLPTWFSTLISIRIRVTPQDDEEDDE